jgi:hypothetical protein
MNTDIDIVPATFYYFLELQSSGTEVERAALTLNDGCE